MLNDLDLADLRRLAQCLADLATAGDALQRCGFGPRFDLTPGAPMRITTTAVMPAALNPDLIKLVSTEAAPISVPVPAPVEPPPALGEGTGGDPVSAEPSRTDDDGDPPQVAASSEAKAESGGGPVMAAAMPLAAPVPGSASALASSTLGGMWTEEEEERLIGLVVAGMTHAALPKTEAIRGAALQLDRGFEGTKSRCYGKLKVRLDAAISAAAMAQAQTEIPEAATVDPGQGGAAAGGDDQAAVQPPELLTDFPEAQIVDIAATFERPVQVAPDDLHGADLQLWTYLQEHRPRWPMTVGTDLDLVVALDLGIDVDALKRRFQVLTARLLDSRGHLTIEGGPRLIRLLRRIAKAPAEAA